MHPNDAIQCISLQKFWYDVISSMAVQREPVTENFINPFAVASSQKHCPRTTGRSGTGVETCAVDLGQYYENILYNIMKMLYIYIYYNKGS